ncbi:RNA polymerase factor sigma-54 [Szabonella alba]|uniref:RNA polymerase sigma-54 factor n=1 Tax=Szabonella alba TaxID=2804194 RepID=A0A8K0VEK9_9RHOB|nr:RNA polymerase sigma-54 factor [Szabonella alba]MBL4918808.1 RNA polymerase sigma-54 factor [Szabonella alba]
MQRGPGTRLEQSQRLQLSAGLASSIRILRHDANGLNRYLEEQAAENPHLLLVPVEPAPGEWTPRWTSAFRALQSDLSETDRIAAGAPGLHAHAMGQMRRLLPAGRAQAIGMVFVEALEPSGWLGPDFAAIAREAGATEAEARAVLTRLQQAEPTGLFAGSLAECLRLQAQEAGRLDPLMSCVLDHLDLLAAGEVERLARMCKTPVAAVMTALRVIRGFDPKPGARFGQGAAPLREPDLLVSKDAAGGWQVALNRSALPDVAIRGEGIGAARQEGSPGLLAAAREVQRQVASRNRTLLAVARAVLAHQAAMLDHGMAALRPLRMADVAVGLGLHPGTVSRAVAGVSFDSPRGTIWLRALFGGRGGAEGRKSALLPEPLIDPITDRALPLAGGADLSAAALRARIAALIAAEDPATPLGDDRLAALLSADGVAIARRTVAKYRDQQGIPPAYRRRRRDPPAGD